MLGTPPEFAKFWEKAWMSECLQEATRIESFTHFQQPQGVAWYEYHNIDKLNMYQNVLVTGFFFKSLAHTFST